MGAGVQLRDADLGARVVAEELLEIRSLRHHTRELLAPATQLPHGATVHGRAAGITLLHPWANRLGADTYAVGGIDADLAGDAGRLSRDATGLALHGLLSPGAWRWEEQAPARAVARLEHEGAAGSAFPFPHDLEVTLELGDGHLRVTTTLTPTGGVAVPVAFGWHPYLRLTGTPRGSWRLALPARRHVAFGPNGLPHGGGEQEAEEERPLATRALDDGFDGLRDGACFGLRDARCSVRVHLERGYPVAQVFAPGSADVVSLEPMTAPVNALVSGEGLRTVAPGERFSAVFSVEVHDCPERR